MANDKEKTAEEKLAEAQKQIEALKKEKDSAVKVANSQKAKIEELETERDAANSSKSIVATINNTSWEIGIEEVLLRGSEKVKLVETDKNGTKTVNKENLKKYLALNGNKNTAFVKKVVAEK